MRISSLSSLFLLFGIAVAQDTSPQACIDETEAMFEANPDLEQSEQDYLEVPAGSMMANCMNATSGVITGCTGINLGQSDRGDTYLQECEQNAEGEMWTYQYTASCTHNDGTKAPEVKYGGIWVCGSKNCTATGIQQIIPYSDFEEVFTADGNYTCESGAMNIVPAAAPGAMGTTLAFMAAAVVSAVSYWM
ncbi:MAG: hypothetical protein SGILL_009596 [Bacillariaceae sp.]